MLYAHRFETPLGMMSAVVDDAGALVKLHFGDLGTGRNGWSWSAQRTAAVTEQVQAYFRGELRTFDVPVAAPGTPFQQRVWLELQRVPYGSTISYAELARRVASAGSARAVGRANGTNPIAIVVPCHRVIASDGSLAGYAGGVHIKRALLELERAPAARAAQISLIPD